MSKISITTLGDLVEFQRGYDLPKSEFKKGNIPVISSNGVLGYHNVAKVKAPGITIGRSGTVGLPHFINEDFFPHNTSLFIKDFKGNHPKYIFYLMKTLKLNEYGSGSGVPTMNRNHLHPIKVSAHLDKSTQQKIAKVLSDLDAKIELNNKINSKLEAMAKTLYDYWFVQFDFPDDNGKPYKTSGGKMVWNEELKREIPEGWEVKKLEEIEKNIITGKTPSTKDEENFGGNIPFVTIDDIRKQLYVFYAERTLTPKGADSQSSKFLQPGDICVSCIGTIGVIGIVGTKCQTNQQINSISNIKDYNRYFLLNALKDYFNFNIAAKKGAVLDNMNKGDFSIIPILDAPNKLKIEYDKIVNSFFTKIENNLKENQQLASLRDWLLPMLMNGQVSVGEVAKEYHMEEEVLGMVAEPTVIYLTPQDKKIRRKMLATFIVNQCLSDTSFGKTKFEKLLHLIEYHLVKNDYNQRYSVQTAGPYDGGFTKVFWDEVTTAKWFKFEELGNLKRIVAGENHEKSLKEYDFFSDDLKQSIRDFITLFNNTNYEKAEVVSTLYAVWNNRIIKNELITNPLLKNDFLEWDKQKARYVDELDDALIWMRKENIVPDGWGKYISRAKSR
jgi:type I restriction enzyme S subunit